MADERSDARGAVVAAARELYAPSVTYLDIPMLQRRLKAALARLDAIERGDHARPETREGD